MDFSKVRQALIPEDVESSSHNPQWDLVPQLRMAREVLNGRLCRARDVRKTGTLTREVSACFGPFL